MKLGVPERTRAEHEGVEEEADEVLGPGLVTTGDGSADGDVCGPGISMEQGIEPRKEGHEWRGLLLSADRFEAAPKCGRQAERA